VVVDPAGLSSGTVTVLTVVVFPMLLLFQWVASFGMRTAGC
jgi:hypothetical protein